MSIIMSKYKGFLKTDQRAAIIAAHRYEKNASQADRLKSTLLLDDGYTFEQISKILLLDDQTVRNYLSKFEKGGTEGLLSDKYVGYSGCLSEDNERELSVHLEEFTYPDVNPVIAYVEFTFGKEYTRSGMRDLLHRLGFTYKKASHVPGKADPDRQQKFIDAFKEFMKNKSPDVPVLFMDATHPQYNSMPAYGWIKKGERKEIKSNTGRERLNINGALNAETREAVVVEADTINAESTILLLKKVEEHYPTAPYIYVFSDNARYYHSEEVASYLRTSRIMLEKIPPYSPNLNPIERLWKFFHKQIHYNKYHETFAAFRLECLMFFERLDEYAEKLASLITLNFNVLDGINARMKTIP